MVHEKAAGKSLHSVVCHPASVQCFYCVLTCHSGHMQTGSEARQAQLLLTRLASHTRVPGPVPAAAPGSSLFLTSLGRQQKTGHLPGPIHPCGRQGCTSRLLASPASPGYCSNLRSESENGRALLLGLFFWGKKYMMQHGKCC